MRFRDKLLSIYYFLPFQLLLLHFRKYQFLLIFWIILVATLTGNFAAHFGAATLFLTPEYMGQINFLSMALLGGAMGVFIMAWHITTFIIHSKRMPFMGSVRHSFLVYCLNNSILPFCFLFFYSSVSVRFQLIYEHSTVSHAIIMQLGFYLGLSIITLISFAYFFRVSRDLVKVLLSKITNPSIIRGIVPYDTLDFEIDVIRVQTYLSDRLQIKKIAEAEQYNFRFLNTVLRRHHRNAIFATIVAYTILLLLGVFIDNPVIRFPAGVSFLFLFSIAVGILGSVKYFLKSWEGIGWIIFAVILSQLINYHIIDLRSIAYGLDYHHSTGKPEPKYAYDHLYHLFNKKRYDSDKCTEEYRLEKWGSKFTTNKPKPRVVLIGVSGGGLRSAYWTFRALQYLDSMSQGKLFANTILLTGASGGMIGAAYWRNLHDAYLRSTISDPYAFHYQENMGKDLLNCIVFSLATIDLISPFNKISVSGNSYTKDRGYALEQEMIRNTEGILGGDLEDYKKREAQGIIPEMIVNGTIINDGRRLMISSQPLGFLTQPEYASKEGSNPTIDAVDYAAFFADQKPYDLRLVSALRMNATFPYILPVVRLPSDPQINIMDAGLRDNFGTEIICRYLFTMRDWIEKNTSGAIFIQLRDTREYEMHPPSAQSSIWDMLSDPLFVIQNKWEMFQSFNSTYFKDFSPYYMNGKLHVITLQYFPHEINKAAELNFHLTQKEKEDIYSSVYHPENKQPISELLQLLNQ